MNKYLTKSSAFFLYFFFFYYYFFANISESSRKFCCTTSDSDLVTQKHNMIQQILLVRHYCHENCLLDTFAPPGIGSRKLGTSVLNSKIDSRTSAVDSKTDSRTSAVDTVFRPLSHQQAIF